MFLLILLFVEFLFVPRWLVLIVVFFPCVVFDFVVIAVDSLSFFFVVVVVRGLLLVCCCGLVLFVVAVVCS